MPRAAKVSDETEEAPKRAPRRRVARAPRKSVVSSGEDAEVSVSERAPVRRKAPTRIEPVSPVASTMRTKQPTPRSLYVSGVLGVLALAGAVLIGVSDSGQINTAAVISERNARVAAGEVVPGAEAESSSVVPVQNASPVRPVSSGGRPMSASVDPTTIATDTASSTASTSETLSEGAETSVSSSTDPETEDFEVAPVDAVVEEVPVEVTPAL
jgi:hypothetical protein